MNEALQREERPLRSRAGEITVTFPGGKRVDAQVGNHRIATDQPRVAGGEDSAPAPFSLFLASIGTCAGIYVLGFCQARGIDPGGIELTQRSVVDPETRALRGVEIDIHVPDGFPAQYHEALVRAASGCAVKKAIAARPEFHISVTGT
ncbi:MAG TPA: OsmC family protein [Myxococcaceae bacterium]|nr:OsmC family protein [Myxococcaceae bacterium]